MKDFCFEFLSWIFQIDKESGLKEILSWNWRDAESVKGNRRSRIQVSLDVWVDRTEEKWNKRSIIRWKLQRKIPFYALQMWHGIYHSYSDQLTTVEHQTFFFRTNLNLEVISFGMLAVPVSSLSYFCMTPSPKWAHWSVRLSILGPC